MAPAGPRDAATSAGASAARTSHTTHPSRTAAEAPGTVSQRGRSTGAGGAADILPGNLGRWRRILESSGAVRQVALGRAGAVEFRRRRGRIERCERRRGMRREAEGAGCPAELSMRAVDRRTTLKVLLALFASGFDRREGVSLASVADTGSVPNPAAAGTASNFRTVYADAKLRRRFYLFLQNVFHLYPEDRFHQLIGEVASRYDSDRESYEKLAERLPEIKPLFSQVTYALPALAKQKEEMARQTAELLGPPRTIKGYVEIGTPGRYVNGLRRRFRIEGAVFLQNDRAPGLSLEDIVERGQVRRSGQYVALGNYDALDATGIPDASVDLITNFIGFHHTPLDRLDPFVASIRRALRPGGRLVLREHDVDGPEMNALVALAHDVFNAGVRRPWASNHLQLRHFTAVNQHARYP